MSGKVGLQGMFLGPTGSVATYNEASLPTGMAGQLGKVVEVGDKKYRLVKFDNGTSNVASVAGGVAHWMDKSAYKVTSDYSDAEAALGSVAGGFLGVVTDGYYCYIQCGGDQAAVVVNTSTAKGNALGASSTDLTLDPCAADTTTQVAIALADDSPSGYAAVRWLPNVLA
jgi:hypothetical protein